MTEQVTPEQVMEALLVIERYKLQSKAEVLRKQIANLELQVPELDKHIVELNLSVRTYNCLRAAEILTLREIMNSKESELIKLRNFGPKGLNEVIELLDKYGLSLKE